MLIMSRNPGGNLLLNHIQHYEKVLRNHLYFMRRFFF